MKHARKTDPTSSYLAAKENEPRRPNQILTVNLMVAMSPNSTSSELSSEYGVDRHMVARRLPDAEQRGLVKKGSMRKCGVSNRLAVTWLPAESQG